MTGSPAEGPKSPYDELKEIKERLTDLNEKSRPGAQHGKGKLTAKERISALADPGSFVELDQFRMPYGEGFSKEKAAMFGDGLMMGYCAIEGRTAVVFAEDFTFMGGSMGRTHLEKIARAISLAAQMRVPVVGLYDSGGARIQEGVQSLAEMGAMFYNNVMASGVVPQIAVIMGPSAGGACYSPALNDFVIMVEKTSYMFITGPKVVKSVTGQDIDSEGLGGPKVHASESGVATFSAPDDAGALRLVKTLLSYLPSSFQESPPVSTTRPDAESPVPEANSLVPLDPKKAYDIRRLIRSVFDEGSFFEVASSFARNGVVGFARIGGLPVGLVATQPMILGGVLDIDVSDKISRFVRFCDSFNLPLVTFVDTPGYMPGKEQEHGGIIRHGAKVIYAYSEATVPKITLVVRKAYGGAYIALCSKKLGADLVLAYPTAEIAVMGPEGGIEIIKKKELDSLPQDKKDEAFARMVADYRKEFMNPFVSAEKGYVDLVIEPAETRRVLSSALDRLTKGKSRRNLKPKGVHGNMPL
jgi:acetyl-CoA carboxylase carboxyltransferase component